MLKKALYIILIFSIILFFVQNTSHVAVTFLSGKTHLRAVFLMLICFSAGYICGFYFFLKKEEILRREIRRLRSIIQNDRKAEFEEE